VAAVTTVTVVATTNPAADRNAAGKQSAKRNSRQSAGVFDSSKTNPRDGI